MALSSPYPDQGSECYVIEGITICKRRYGDIIMPEDDNAKVDIILALLDKLDKKVGEIL